jgi:hypothetical protein
LRTNVGRKVVIYLDQNFISDKAKLSLDDKKGLVKPDLQKIFNVIKLGTDEEKFIASTGWVQELETAAEQNPELRDAIRSHQGYIGQVDFDHCGKSRIRSSLMHYIWRWWQLALSGECVGRCAIE